MRAGLSIILSILFTPTWYAVKQLVIFRNMVKKLVILPSILIYTSNFTILSNKYFFFKCSLLNAHEWDYDHFISGQAWMLDMYVVWTPVVLFLCSVIDWEAGCKLKHIYRLNKIWHLFSSRSALSSTSWHSKRLRQPVFLTFQLEVSKLHFYLSYTQRSNYSLFFL